MESRNSEGQYGNPDVSSSGGENAGTQARTRVHLSAEEMEVLRQCNRESFWFRCVPLGIAFIATTQYLVSRGIWKPHPSFGALFKNMGAGLAAFVIGKMSYQSKCREKILQLENSALADSIRKSRTLATGIPSSTQSEGSESYSIDSESFPSDSEQRMRKVLESDGGRMEFKGLDDSLRPSTDRETYHRNTDTLGDQPANKLSYDELRARNRREYDMKVQGKPSDRSVDKHSEQSTSQSGHRETSPSASDKPTGAGQSSVKRNKYGDIIES